MTATPTHGPDTARNTEASDIRPFEVNVPEADLEDLRRRLAATRWPDRETVPDRSQGAPLADLQELVRYWATDYDWRRGEASLNAWPQFMTEVDGVGHWVAEQAPDEMLAALTAFLAPYRDREAGVDAKASLSLDT
jgi:pimeloyl-ACP methyl ester carboxylesterase